MSPNPLFHKPRTAFHRRLSQPTTLPALPAEIQELPAKFAALGKAVQVLEIDQDPIDQLKDPNLLSEPQINALKGGAINNTREFAAICLSENGFDFLEKLGIDKITSEKCLEVMGLTRIRGIGLQTAKKIHEKTDIKTIENLAEKSFDELKKELVKAGIDNKHIEGIFYQVPILRHFLILEPGAIVP